MLERPQCAECNVDMWIEYVEDHPDNGQLKVIHFACATCKAETNVTVDRSVEVSEPE